MYCGTSGYSYNWWKSDQSIGFYPKDKGLDELKYYSTQFNTVELNNTFYKNPTEKVCKDWFNRTPDDFIFSAKVCQYITHFKKQLKVLC